MPLSITCTSCWGPTFRDLVAAARQELESLVLHIDRIFKATAFLVSNDAGNNEDVLLSSASNMD